MIRRLFPILFAALFLSITVQFAHASQPVRDGTWPMRQGLHEHAIAGGKLVLVVGTYQDVLAFRRTYHVYFIVPGHEEWNQVPLLAKPGAPDFALASASAGDVTLEDWLSVKRGDKFYLVRASRRADKGLTANGDVTATWFQFIEAPDDEPDGPAYSLQPVFKRQYGASSRHSVETVLRKESTLQPSK